MNSDNQVADPAAIRENKLSLVERLADDLAHEIKNPLHSMVINLEVLRRRLTRLGSESSEELQRYTTVLGSELERVNRRVDLLLRMVRPHRASDEPTSLGEVFEELHELVTLECERHQVQLRMELPDDSIGAHLPRAAMRQLVLSMILKLLDTLPAGSTLSIRSTVEGGWVHLIFTGQGIGRAPLADSPPEVLSYLPVARALAEGLGGSLEVQRLALGSGPEGERAESDSYVLSLPHNR